MESNAETYPVGPLAKLLESAREAVELLGQARGEVPRESTALYVRCAHDLNAAMCEVRPLANAENGGRCCSTCGATLEDLTEIGSILHRLGTSGAMDISAQLLQHASEVAGFCSSTCWASGSPETFPSTT
jgi:hypothetical protein